jgi:hypothetical protein
MQSNSATAWRMKPGRCLKEPLMDGIGPNAKLMVGSLNILIDQPD